MSTERIVITGAGAASPFGLGARALYEGMLAGETRVSPLEEPRASLAPGYGAVVDVKNGEIRKLPNSRDMRPGTMTRYTFLSTLALGTAIENSGQDWEDEEKSLRRGCYAASYTNSDRFDKYVRFAHAVSVPGANGGAEIDDSRINDAIRKFTSFEFLKLMNNMPTAHAGIQAKCQGPCNTFLGTAAAGLQAVGRAYEAIRDGLADTMYAGGTGSSAHDQMMMVRATRRLNADPSAEPARAGRPFDRGATGIVPGEGAAYLVLERESTAKARGAGFRAELAGWADWFSAPAGDRELPPNAAGPLRAMRKALERAGLEAKDLDVVVATGESRVDIDAQEATALAELLGPRVGEVPVVALTAHVGSTEAAVGPLGAVVALEMMREGKVPGALNREDPLPEYKGPTGSEAMELPVRTVMVVTTTREGVNAAVVLRAID